MPFVAKAESLMGLRGPTLYAGPTIKLALVASSEDGYATENYVAQRIVELPFEGRAAFGGRLTIGGVTGLVAGFGGPWPEPGPCVSPSEPDCSPEFGRSCYSPEKAREIAENIIRGSKPDGWPVFYSGEEDGELYIEHRVREKF